MGYRQFHESQPVRFHRLVFIILFFLGKTRSSRPAFKDAGAILLPICAPLQHVGMVAAISDSARFKYVPRVDFISLLSFRCNLVTRDYIIFRAIRVEKSAVKPAES